MEEEDFELYPEVKRELPKKSKTIEELQQLCKIWAEKKRLEESKIVSSVEETAVNLFS